jgi:hypothetical protein
MHIAKANCISKALVQLYVDDTNLLFEGNINDLDSLRNDINDDMSSVNQWMILNNMYLHDGKTKVIMISSKARRRAVCDFSFIFNGIVIENSDTIKCLGLTIDCTLSWENHVNNIAKACNYRINSLYKIRENIPTDYRKLLASTLVLPLINYMSAIWCSASAKVLHVLEKVMRTLARFVSGVRKYDSVAGIICNEFEWLFPKELGEFKILCIFYNLTNCFSIDFFNEYFVRNIHVHRYPTSSAMNFNCNFLPRQNIGYTSFHFTAISLWNSLPIEIKEASSLKVFKARLKRHLLDKQVIQRCN